MSNGNQITNSYSILTNNKKIKKIPGVKILNWVKKRQVIDLLQQLSAVSRKQKNFKMAENNNHEQHI